MITSNVEGKVQAYIDGVMSGEIITCERVNDAVRRHLADLERQSTNEFPYHFDRREAESVCSFFPALLRHSIGEFAGKPFDLEPWQAFGLWCIFGWKRDCDNSRRFRKVYWSMARKNGKSSIAAGLCLFLGCGDIDPATGKPEAVGQILLTATKKEQAEVVYSEAVRMRQQSPSIDRLSNVKHETIHFQHSGSYIRKVSSEKPFDGLNPHCVVMDELHAWGEYHRKFYDTMVTGSGSRTQPLHLIITTAGADDSHLWRENYEYACNVLQGNYRDETLFAAIYEADEGDDPNDESVWMKGNPNLGISCKLDYLRTQWNESRHTAQGRNRFTRYNLNRMVSSTEKAIDLDKYDACVKDLTDWSGADALGAGVDLGSRDDLAAFALCARFVDGWTEGRSPIYRYEFRVKAFIAADTPRQLDIMPFSQFIYDGDLQRVQYPMEELTQALIEQCGEFGVQTVAYDQYNALQLSEKLSKEGLIAAKMAQNQANFNEPIREFLKLMNEGRLAFPSSRLLRWSANNLKISRDRQDRWMLDKAKSEDKIDPIVAMVMAFRVASLQPERSSGSMYLT